jgi:nucleotide-binding universal stress UspA family protein
VSTVKSAYRIVIAYDFSSTAKLALEAAFEQALSRGGPLEIHATVVIDDGTGGLPLRTRPMDSVQHQVDTARTMLSDEVRAMRASHLDGTDTVPLTCNVHVRLGDPAWHITSLAAELRADLVVVGTHGRRGLDRLLIGSVAERVVRTAPCPVLVVRPVDETLMQTVPKIEPPDPDAPAPTPTKPHHYGYSSVLEPYEPPNRML